MTNEKLKQLLKTIRRLYREAKRESNATQAEFAEQIGIPVTTLNFILNGYRPGRSVQERLQKYLEEKHPESVEK